MKKWMRLSGISLFLIVIVALAFASKGGGNRKKSAAFKNDFVPIRTTNGFTLKSGVAYSGSHFFSVEKTDKNLSFNSVVTYQKGNTTYILPYKYKVNGASFNTNGVKTNFQMLNLRIKMHK